MDLVEVLPANDNSGITVLAEGSLIPLFLTLAPKGGSNKGDLKRLQAKRFTFFS